MYIFYYTTQSNTKNEILVYTKNIPQSATLYVGSGTPVVSRFNNI